MTDAVAMPLAVGTGVVVIVVAIAIVLVVLIVALSMRGRQMRAATRRGAERKERAAVGDRAQPSDSDRDVTAEQSQQRDD
jgi:hypothetical protein